MKIFNVKELAQYLNIAPITIYRQTKRGEIPHFKIGRHLKFSQIDIDRWLEEQVKRSFIPPAAAPSIKLPGTPDNVISQIAEKIVAAIHPRKIILFGSHTWGAPDRDSDIDFCVIHSTTLRKDKRARIIKDLLSPYPRPLDIVVYTPEEFEKLKDVEGSLLKKIMDGGIILYDENHD